MGNLPYMLPDLTKLAEVFTYSVFSSVGKARDVRVVLEITLSFGVIFIALCALFIWMRVKKRRGNSSEQLKSIPRGNLLQLIQKFELVLVYQSLH